MENYGSVTVIPKVVMFKTIPVLVSQMSSET